jgi:hypothetical protein
MYLARIVTGRKPQVYYLTGCLHFPRAWRFVSYGRGAAAIDQTQMAALKAARQTLRRENLTGSTA